MGTISSSYMHHGKRLKLAATFEEGSKESFDVAQAELNAQLRERRRAATAKVVRQSFRKKKVAKDD